MAHKSLSSKFFLKLFDNRFERGIDIISFTLTLFVLFSASAIFLPIYFSPGYLTAYRSFAMINTALAYYNDLQPFSVLNPNGTANVYSFLWPLIIATLGRTLNISTAEGFRTIAFSLNLISLVSVIFFICFYGYKKKLSITIISAMVLVCFVANHLRVNLGEVPYAAGINLSIFGILIGSEASKQFKILFLSSAIFFLAIMFKIYFVFCAIPLVISGVFYALKGRKNFILFISLGVFWVSIVFLIDFFFPFFLTYAVGMSILGTHYSPDAFKEFNEILFNFGWYYLVYIIFTCSLLLRKYSLETYCHSACIVLLLLYVTFDMGRATGTTMNYTIHIITPFLIYILSKVEGKIDRMTIGFSTILFISILWYSQPPKYFGILEKHQVTSNIKTLNNVKNILEELKGKAVFTSGVFSHLAYDYSFEYVDAGHREDVANWQNRKHQLNNIRFLNLFGWQDNEIVDTHYADYLLTADYALCTYHCPKLGSGFVLSTRIIGQIQTARNALMTAHLFIRKRPKSATEVTPLLGGPNSIN